LIILVAERQKLALLKENRGRIGPNIAATLTQLQSSDVPHALHRERGIGNDRILSIVPLCRLLCILSVHHPNFIDGSSDIMLTKLTFKCTVQAQASGKKKKKGKIEPVKIILVKGRKGT
jgi:hypothetical protein